MKLDISSIASSNGGKVSFRETAFFEPVVFCGSEFVFAEGVKIGGEIANQAGEFILEAQVDGFFKTDCARCGKLVTESFSFELNEKLIKEGSVSTDEDAVVFEGNEIDLVDLAVNGFLMNASGRYLCNEDCKGLCPVCGKDRNVEECSCEDDDIDPRLSILDNIKF